MADITVQSSPDTICPVPLQESCGFEWELVPNDFDQQAAALAKAVAIFDFPPVFVAGDPPQHNPPATLSQIKIFGQLANIIDINNNTLLQNDEQVVWDTITGLTGQNSAFNVYQWILGHPVLSPLIDLSTGGVNPTTIVGTAAALPASPVHVSGKRFIIRFKTNSISLADFSDTDEVQAGLFGASPFVLSDAVNVATVGVVEPVNADFLEGYKLYWQLWCQDETNGDSIVCNTVAVTPSTTAEGDVLPVRIDFSESRALWNLTNTPFPIPCDVTPSLVPEMIKEVYLRFGCITPKDECGNFIGISQRHPTADATPNAIRILNAYIPKDDPVGMGRICYDGTNGGLVESLNCFGIDQQIIQGIAPVPDVLIIKDCVCRNNCLWFYFLANANSVHGGVLTQYRISGSVTRTDGTVINADGNVTLIVTGDGVVCFGVGAANLFTGLPNTIAALNDPEAAAYNIRVDFLHPITGLPTALTPIYQFNLKDECCCVIVYFLCDDGGISYLEFCEDSRTIDTEFVEICTEIPCNGTLEENLTNGGIQHNEVTALRRLQLRGEEQIAHRAERHLRKLEAFKKAKNRWIEYRLSDGNEYIVPFLLDGGATKIFQDEESLRIDCSGYFNFELSALHS